MTNSLTTISFHWETFSAWIPESLTVWGFLVKLQRTLFLYMNLYSSILTLYTFDWILCRQIFANWQGAYSLWRGRPDQELFWHFLIINITLRHHFKNTGRWVFAQFFLCLSFFCSTAQRLSWQTTLPADNHLCLTPITFLRHRASHSFNEVRTRLICKPNSVAWRKFKA